MRIRNTNILLSLGLLLMLAPRHALAERDAADANGLFQKGAEAVRAGDMKSALAYFESAYATSPHFAVLYNIGMARAGLGDASAAVQAFERYLAEGQSAVPAERRALVEAEIRRQAALTGSLLVEVSPKTATVSLDGVQLGPDRLGQKMRVNPGNHLLRAIAQGHVAAERTLTVAKGEELQVQLALVPTPPAPTAPVAVAASTPDVTPPPPVPLPAAKPSDEQPTGSWQRVLGYSAAAAGLVTAGIGLGVYLNGRSSWQSAVDNGCTNQACPEPAASYWRDAEDSFRAARILFVAGGVVAAGGVVLVLLAPSRRAPQLSLAPVASAHNAGVMVAGHW